MAISTSNRTNFEPLVVLEAEKKDPNRQLERREKKTFEKWVCLVYTMWRPWCHVVAIENGENYSFVWPYQPPLAYFYWAKQNPLELERKKFMEQVLSFSINTPFIKAMAEIPKFAKDVMRYCNDLEKAPTIVFCNNYWRVDNKDGRPRASNFALQIRTNVLAYSGASINLMPYSFYRKLELPMLKNTRMTIHMEYHMITCPPGIIEYLLVKVGKFIFPLDFVVIDMKKMKTFL